MGSIDIFSDEFTFNDLKILELLSAREEPY